MQGATNYNSRFQYPCVDIPSESLQFSELLRSLSLIQDVNQPTHKKSHILDLIISRSADNIILSDPAPVHLFSKHSLFSQKVTCRSKSINLPIFLADLASSDLCTNPPDDHLEELVASYSSTLPSIYDQHGPPRTKTIVTRPRVPCFITSSKQGKRARRKAERKWRQSYIDHEHLAEFKH